MNFELLELLYNIPELQDLSYHIYRQMPEQTDRNQYVHAVWQECEAVADPDIQELLFRLDDANVVRFAHYMRTMAERTQFIVITHRRGTMEEADVLYGVTMQEQGVSRMLTINLNDVEKELNIR